MEERSLPPAEAPPLFHPDGDRPVTLEDPRVLQILTTEHWSLLAGRSLVYNEAFSRAGMYLSFLSATIVALGLIAAATGFSSAFLMIAAGLLAIDLFIGYASLGRIASASSEDIRFLQSMNRIRHAYVEIAPATEPYFMTGHHDDATTVLGLYGTVAAGPASQIIHGLTTTPGMIGTINSGVGGALAAILTMLLTGDPQISGIVGVVASLVLFVVLAFLTQRTVARFWTGMPTMFPRDSSRR